VFCIQFVVPLPFFVWSLYCMSFDLRLLVTSLLSLIYGFWLPLCYLWFTASGYLFAIFDLRLLGYLFVIFDLRLLGYLFVIFDLRLLVTSLLSLIYGFWLPLWYLRFTASWLPLWYLRFTASWLPLWYLRFTASWLPLWYLWFTASWLPLWYLQTVLLLIVVYIVIQMSCCYVCVCFIVFINIELWSKAYWWQYL
jgi:hypothetical protein